jgi:hypothetical protein
MRSRVVAGAACLAAGMLLAALPAHAERLAVADPEGDAVGDRLDITAVALANRDNQIAVSFHFVRDEPSTVGVLLKTHRRPARAFVSVHHSSGPDDVHLFARSGVQIACTDAMRSVWDRGAATLTMHLPSACFQTHGRYHAVKFQALVEAPAGADADAAPEDTTGDAAWTDWIPRG